MSEWLWCEDCDKMTLHDVSNAGTGIMTVCKDCKKQIYYVKEELLEK
jgi:hypothetical protein